MRSWVHLSFAAVFHVLARCSGAVADWATRCRIEHEMKALPSKKASTTERHVVEYVHAGTLVRCTNSKTSDPGAFIEQQITGWPKKAQDEWRSKLEPR